MLLSVSKMEQTFKCHNLTIWRCNMAIINESIIENSALHCEEELLSTTLLSIGCAVIIINKDGLITDLNASAEDFFSFGKENIKGRHFCEVFKLPNNPAGKELEKLITEVLQAGTTISLSNALSSENEHKHFVAGSLSPIKNGKGDIWGATIIWRDIFKEKDNSSLFSLSYRDFLTGLYNRRFMEEEIEKFDTPSQMPLAVLMGDVNGLKLTNDAFGHQAGDMLLQKVANVMMENCRKRDIIGRWGGDEFLILLPQTDAETVERIGKRIKKTCSKIYNNIQCNISLGSSVKTKPEEDFQHVLKEAEEWMYRKKLLEGRSYRSTIINSLISSLSKKSIETEEHTERVVKYCLIIGEVLKLSRKELNELNLTAKLHDIGKAAIEESILQKVEPLTSEEWAEIKKHPQIGYNIALNVPELSHVAEYILCHHERWDGKGYPNGLAKEKIPLPSRILAVVDSFDAMTTDRSYKKAIDHKAAIEELKANAGTQFDPAIVDIFINNLAKIHI